MTKDDHMYVSELHCTQEEADTRIVLHASMCKPWSGLEIVLIQIFDL